MRSKRRVSKPRLALIDGELIAYSMVTSGNFLKEQHNSDDEYWHSLDMKGCKEEFDVAIDELTGLARAQSHIIFFGAKGNFRKRIEPNYKAGRANKKPLGYWAFVDWIKENYVCVGIDELEADDAMGIYHTSPELTSHETVLVSIDKDMRTLPGLLFAQGKSDKPELITEAAALTFWMAQTLIGDTVDGYKGCPGIGEKKAAELLPQEMIEEALECGDFDQAASVIFQGVIVPQFMAKGLGEDHALLQARLARILRAGDFDVEDPNATVRLWTPGGSTKTTSSKVHGRKRRKRRV